MSAKTWICFSLLACVCLVSALLVACGNNGNVSSSSPGGNQGGGSPGGSNGQAAISVTLSDPTVCSASQGGPFQHIYVTITDVQIFPSASPPLQNGVDLTPGLNQSPAQVDLLTNFELYVSPGNPLVGVFSPTGTKYKQGTTGSATYNVDTQSSCNPSTVRSTAVSVSPGGSSSVPTIGLQGCPAG